MSVLPSFMASPGIGAAPPPPTFIRYLPQGEIRDAWRTTESPFSGRRARRSGAQKAGLAYQSRIGAWASDGHYLGSVVSGPWYCYVDGGGARRYCQPDLVFDDGLAIVACEVKLRWTVDAWWQLRKLYLPVLQVAHGRRTPVLSLCICRSYDPAVQVPEPVNLVDDVAGCKPDSFNVLVVR